jgi:hypothetical protein
VVSGRTTTGAARFFAGLVAAFIVFLAVVAPASAQQDDTELAARTHFLKGEYKQALDGYVQLYNETLHPTYLRNIGRCFQSLGEPDKAINAFRDYLRKAPSLTAEQRTEIEGFITEMKDHKRSREAEAAPAAAAAAPLPRAPEPAAERTAGKVDMLTTKAPSEPADATRRPPVYERWWFWTAAAAVVIGAGVTAIALSTSSSGAPTTDFGVQTANPK